MTDVTADRLTIRQLVEDWAVLRDARMWDRFRTVWHDDGVMQATWFQGSRDEFIKVSEEGWQKRRAHPAFPRRLDHRRVAARARSRKPR